MIPVEIETLYTSNHMVIRGTSVIKVAPEGIFPAPHERLAID